MSMSRVLAAARHACSPISTAALSRKKDAGVDIDTEKIDQTVLALLCLGRHDGFRTWKGFDWDVMSRLHEKGYISDPRSKAKSVVFTEEGLHESERLFQALFVR
jgi:hypothetical protein